MNSSLTLLQEIDEFLAETGMTQTRFGLDAMNNSSFVRQLRNGHSVTLRTMDRVRTFMLKARAARAEGKVPKERGSRRADARAA
jgi:hypothetical protein